MNKVYIKLTPGLANQLYEYMAAYALSKKLNRELILDISGCRDSADAYLLDMFCIPKHKKIWYPLSDAGFTHPSVKDMPARLAEKVIVFSDTTMETPHLYYDGLDQILPDETLADRDIYLCGWFFQRKYYADYWEELKKCCRLRKDTDWVASFRRRTEGKEIVGIHIRRGDFVTGTMAVNLPPADFWKAAVMWFRKRIKNCLFCVFSDDIAYAKDVLGSGGDLCYVHFGNGGSAAISEFLCLSLCRHKILSNGSTFSRLADEISCQEDRITIKYDRGYASYRLTTRIRKRLERVALPYGRKAGRQELELNDFDIKRLGKKYRSNTSKLFSGHRTSLESFLALAEDERYDLALDVAYCNYLSLRLNKEFQKKFIEVLIKTGHTEEAVLEAAAIQLPVDVQTHLYGQLVCDRTLHFVIVPYGKSRASSRVTELVCLGVALWHLGHKVSLIMEPESDEEIYMRKSQQLITRREVALGPEQYVWQDVMEQGPEKFLSRVSCPGERLLVIARRTQFLEQKLAPVIFPDYSYPFDLEKLGGVDTWSEERLTAEADYLLTCDTRFAGGNVIRYYQKQEDGLHEEEEVLLDKQHRLSVRHIYMAAAIMEKLKRE